jgi:hypothetical protein
MRTGPEAKDKAATPAVQHEFLFYSLVEFMKTTFCLSFQYFVFMYVKKTVAVSC